MDEQIKRRVAELDTERQRLLGEAEQREQNVQQIRVQHREWMDARRTRLDELNGGVQELQKLLSPPRPPPALDTERPDELHHPNR